MEVTDIVHVHKSGRKYEGMPLHENRVPKSVGILCLFI